MAVDNITTARCIDSPRWAKLPLSIAAGWTMLTYTSFLLRNSGHHFAASAPTQTTIFGLASCANSMRRFLQALIASGGGATSLSSPESSRGIHATRFVNASLYFSAPDCRIISSSNFPDGPTRGRPIMSSDAPGASATMRMSHGTFPLPSTMLVRLTHNLQSWQFCHLATCCSYLVMLFRRRDRAKML